MQTIVTLVALAMSAGAVCAERFTDDFSNGLAGWEIHGDAAAVAVVDSGEERYGPVMELTPAGLVYALIRGSEDWGPVRIEGEVKFPTDGDSYLGLVYNYVEGPSRTDFGSIYIKGNGGYLRVNPWRDGNASRLLYEEYRTAVPGVMPQRWLPFAAELAGTICHFYLLDESEPRLTFSLLELEGGAIGFKPRIAGSKVWIDNIRVDDITGLSYRGPPRPEVDYQPQAVITDWEALGPLSAPLSNPEGARGWRPFQTDARGAVVTGRVTEYRGTRPVAYFRTSIKLDEPDTVVLHVTTADELSLFVDGRFFSFIYRDGYVDRGDWNVWHDFWRAEGHGGRRIALDLGAGRHSVILGVRNGQFASGGFFARWE